MSFHVISFLVLSFLALSYANTLQATLDLKRLQTILAEGVKSKDISSVYYAVKGLKLLNVKIPEICQDIGNTKYDIKNIEQIFYLTNAAELSGCINYLHPDILSASTLVLDNKDASIPDLFYAVYARKAINKGAVMDKDSALKNLIKLLKKDDSPANYGYVFTLCEHIGCEDWTQTHAEGVLLAADETDGKALQFEGGLPVTSMLLTSIVRSYKSQKKPTPLTEEQRYKFSEYLLSRRSVNGPRGVALLLEAAMALADDEPSPISIAIKGRKYITPETDTIELSITDLLGRPVKGLKPEDVIAQSGTRLTDDVVVLSKQPLTQKTDEPTTFILNLSKIKSQHGLYRIALSAGSKSTNVNISVLGEIQVSNVEIGIGDADGTTSPKITTVTYPNQHTEKLQADNMQKVTLKFTVRDKSGKPVLVQQAFLRVAPSAPGAPPDQETIFVAEPDNTKAYKVELNAGALAKHVGGSSGAYSLTLYLGDSAARGPVAWPLGDVHFHFGKEPATAGPVASGGGVARAQQPPRGALPEIHHQFREPEARPPRVVSDVFACACAAPLLLLLALWARLRVNFSNFPLSISALLFHLALGGSLGLYAVLWLQLSMFETVRYLLPLGALTFLSGHRLLRRLASDKQTR